jgi:hypothetical protein
MPTTNPVIDDLRRIQRELAALRKIKITVGVQTEDGVNIHGQTASADDTLMKIAHVHEYGMTIQVTSRMRGFLHSIGLHLKPTTDYVNIPERSFIRAAYEKGRTALSDTKTQIIADLIAGKIDAMGAAEALGKAAVELTVGMMGADAKPVTDFTLEHRKESKTGAPLHDTGNLLNHITYRIEGGGND